jgi:cellulose synthase/poly-beta-1,6-N-acetylglucosamine synthase-like glycosyltransferase
MPDPLGPEPLVAVIIPALNEAGKIGRVLDKIPRDGRFEAIVVDDGSTDGTGDEARAHGAAWWSATRCGAVCGPPSATAGRPGWCPTGRTLRRRAAESGTFARPSNQVPGGQPGPAARRMTFWYLARGSVAHGY